MFDVYISDVHKYVSIWANTLFHNCVIVIVDLSSSYSGYSALSNQVLHLYVYYY